MTAAYRQALAPQHAEQHACAHEWMVQVQRIDYAHQCQIGVADRSGQVVHRAPVDAQQFGLPLDGQIVLTVDHRLSLSNPALVSAPSKRSFSSAN